VRKGGSGKLEKKDCPRTFENVKYNSQTSNLLQESVQCPMV